MKPRVKVCGVRRATDAELAVELDAALIGCVLAQDSPRCATVSEVAAIRDAVAGEASLVLVFRGEDREFIARAAHSLDVKRVQPHGAAPALCDALEADGLIVHRVASLSVDADELPELVPAPSESRPWVLDCGRGGSGRSFEWGLLDGAAPQNVYIAGGIDADNVAALLAHAPYGIDLSSGIESAPGVKDHAEMRRLFEHLKTHD